MNILVACEESQEVCKAFRNKGHEAYSCDIQPCSGGHPEWHLKMDVFEAINLLGWDMLIGFPPCTHLASAGGAYFKAKRLDGRQKQGIIFFMRLMAAPIKMICLENPVGILSSDYINNHFPELIPDLSKLGLPRKPDCVIQPYFFGDPVRKYTCLWTKNLHNLIPTNIVEPAKPTKFMVRKGKYRTGTLRALYWQDMIPKKDRAKIKSKTFPGIAKAMANQWG